MVCVRPLELGPVLVPCGRCLACRIARSKEWAERCLHELEFWKENSFVTLTYSDEHLPIGGNLVKSHLQLFIKRLRETIREEKRSLRYFACGEYGETYGRPHYHLILFGIGIRDKDIVCEVWPQGRVHMGTVTRDSCQYVSGYVMDKDSGKKDPLAHLHTVKPFQMQSQGIGKDWLDAHADQVLYDVGIRRNGKVEGMPRYYRKRLGDRLSQDDIDQRAKRRIVETRTTYEAHGLEDKRSVAEYERKKRAQREEELKSKQARKRKKI